LDVNEMGEKNAILIEKTRPFLQRWMFHGLYILASAAMVAALIGPQDYARIAIFLALALVVTGLIFGIILADATLNELVGRAETAESARQAHQQVEELFAMTDMLQAAEDHDDAGAILMATSLRLLPEFSGALYVFNNSRDRLDLAMSWNETENFSPAQSLLPSNCWALKRGKPHINDPGSKTLCCMHHISSAASVELPMMARGTVYGLLMLATESEGAYERLFSIRRLSRALADSMSLALSNIALREKLRTQSLRDPLTGLYNRRYMEDALERYLSLAERNDSKTSVIMIDLDNFKKLNDTNGHAKGDAVLRDVAAQLVGGLRPSDVVSRYGGEELLVILPDCDLEDARHKAEMLRARIEALSETHGVPVTASFGIATIPETSGTAIDLIPMADAALYVAKQAGKNCVRTAERRTNRDDHQPRLAVG